MKTHSWPIDPPRITCKNIHNRASEYNKRHPHVYNRVIKQKSSLTSTQ